MVMFLFRLTVVAALVSSAACTDTDSSTNLHSAGPPKVQQVRITESFVDATGTTQTRRVFGFGTHPQATSDQEHAVTSAIAAGDATTIKFRVIMDQLILGNNLE